MGLTVHDAAAQAGVRVSTVRDQLSSIFSKTGTSRQSELISIFSRLNLVL
jgi:DNA-binding NarL/FixJ family response regulator